MLLRVVMWIFMLHATLLLQLKLASVHSLLGMSAVGDIAHVGPIRPLIICRRGRHTWALLALEDRMALRKTRTRPRDYLLVPVRVAGGISRAAGRLDILVCDTCIGVVERTV
jgi:hypothetical protein